MINIQVPGDKERLQKQIQALEWQLEQDTNDKDKEIHQRALEELKKRL